MLPASSPFLVSALTFGTIAFVIFFVSTVVLTIPVLAARGRAQLAWLGGVGVVLVIEAVVLITLTVIQSSTGTGTTEGPDAGPVVVSGGTVTIQLKDNLFDPKDLSVKVGEEVTITVSNVGKAVHNMHVLSKAQEGQEFASDLLVNPGAESTFKVKFSKAGTVNFQCDYHLPDMVGVFTVVE